MRSNQNDSRRSDNGASGERHLCRCPAPGCEGCARSGAKAHARAPTFEQAAASEPPAHNMHATLFCLHFFLSGSSTAVAPVSLPACHLAFSAHEVDVMQ